MADEPVKAKKTLKDTKLFTEVPVPNGIYFVTNDHDGVNRFDVFYVPDGVDDVKSDDIDLLFEDLTLDEALVKIAGKVKQDVAGIPTEAPPAVVKAHRKAVKKAAAAPTESEAPRPAKKGVKSAAAVKATEDATPTKATPAKKMPAKKSAAARKALEE